MKPGPGDYPCALVRTPRVKVQRVAGFAFLVCFGCGRAGDVEPTLAALSVAEIRHAWVCPVAQALHLLDNWRAARC